MKYIFIYLWYVFIFIVTLILVLAFSITNIALVLWYFDYTKHITWKRFMRRKFGAKTYLTDIDIIATFLNMSGISDEGEILCDKNCNPFN